jgi:hypothetical protein
MHQIKFSVYIKDREILTLKNGQMSASQEGPCYSAVMQTRSTKISRIELN